MAKKKDQIIDDLLLEAYWRKREALPDETQERCPVCGKADLQWKHSLGEVPNGTCFLKSVIWCDSCFVGLMNEKWFDDATEVPAEIPLTPTYLEGFPHQSKLRTLGGQARRQWRPPK
jgi:hypothetical protein